MHARPTRTHDRGSIAPPVWVLGVKTDSFARVAWERGRDIALALERRVCESLIDVLRDVLPAGNVLVHASASDLFGFALLVPSRFMKLENPNDLTFGERSMLGAIERTVCERAGVKVFAGWTLLGAGDDATRGIAEAAERGRTFEYRREFATLLHDLTTPVASIHGSLVAATDGILPADVTRRFLDCARSESERVGRLIRGFLSAQHDYVHACDAFSILERAIASLEPLALARAARIEMCERSAHVATAIGGDCLTTIFVSLLENAIKHGAHGGVVRARSIVDGDFVRIDIDDDGPGIDERCMERIFQFGAREGVADGSGIGLAHARLLVVAAGGEISASRSSRDGACFTVRLPLLAARRHPSA